MWISLGRGDSADFCLWQWRGVIHRLA
jgi:hypothetical protein